MNKLFEIQQKHPFIKYITVETSQVYPLDNGNASIVFNCKNLTIKNGVDCDYQLVINGVDILNPGDSITYEGDEGEYKTGTINWNWGTQVGVGTKQWFIVNRTEYA